MQSLIIVSVEHVVLFTLKEDATDAEVSNIYEPHFTQFFFLISPFIEA